MKFNFHEKREHFDRRTHIRLDVALPVMVNQENGTVIPALVNELSVTGMRVVLPVEIEGDPLDELGFLMKLTNETGCHHLFFKGEVVRKDQVDNSTQHRYAIAFTEISSNTQNLIDSFIFSELQTMDEKVCAEAVH